MRADHAIARRDAGGSQGFIGSRPQEEGASASPEFQDLVLAGRQSGTVERSLVEDAPGVRVESVTFGNGTRVFAETYADPVAALEQVLQRKVAEIMDAPVGRTCLILEDDTVYREIVPGRPGDSGQAPDRGILSSRSAGRLGLFDAVTRTNRSAREWSVGPDDEVRGGRAPSAIDATPTGVFAARFVRHIDGREVWQHHGIPRPELSNIRERVAYLQSWISDLPIPGEYKAALRHIHGRYMDALAEVEWRAARTPVEDLHRAGLDVEAQTKARLVEAFTLAHPHIAIVGFDHPDVPAHVVEEILGALDEMFTRFPGRTNIRGLWIDYLGNENAGAASFAQRDSASTFRTLGIQFSLRNASRPAWTVERGIELRERGFNPVGDRPFHHDAVHEFVHAIDAVELLSPRLPQVLHETWSRLDELGLIRETEQTWLARLPAYAFVDETKAQLREYEALAVGFAETDLHGAAVGTPQWVIHEYVTTGRAPQITADLDVRLLNEAVRDGRGPLRGEHFPVPGLRMRSNDPGRNAALRLFSLWQAYVANRGLGKLVSRWDSAPAPESRRRLLAQLYFWISQQRYMRQVWAAERDPSVVGEHGESHPDYFRTRLGDDAHNSDLVGRQTGLRAGVRRDPSTGKWRGGVGTPAFWTTLAIGRLVKNRMDAEAPGGTMLQNVVELPGGVRVDGNVLYALEHDRFVIETARADDQRTIFDAALAELATALGQRSPQPSPELLRRLANAVYLLFQAPLMTRGSDATIRTFAATVFTFAFGRPLRLPHDIDLQAMSRRQSDFVEWFAGALRRGLRTVGDSEAAGRPHARAATTGVDDRPPGFIGSRPRAQSDSSLDAARGAWPEATRQFHPDVSGKDGWRQRHVADPGPAGFSDNEFALTVRAALADLADPATAEQLVMLHLVEGRSLARTAERLGLGVGAASELLAETAARLRGAFDHREPGDATTSERNRPTPWSTARAQPDQPPSPPVSPGDSAPDEGTTRPGGFIGSRPPEPGDSARGPAPEQTPGTTTPWSRLSDRDAHQGVGDEGEVPGTTASPTAAASARVVEFLLGCLTRRDTIYWCQLTPDGLFPEWAWSSDEQLPVLAPDLPISCIDMVVYAAMAAGVLGREQARAIYHWADPDDFTRRWVPELPDLLVPAGRQLLSDHDTAPRPQHGDVVMWFGSVVPGGDERLMHVAVADGEAHRGTGSASVLSFGADCSWLLSQPRRGDAKMSGVELTTIADISDTMLANWSHTVRVEFGPGPWTQPPATGGELRVPPSRESRALRPFNKKNWRRTFPGAAAWVQGWPDAQRWTAAFDEWERAEGAAGASTRLVELIDAAISSTRIEETLRSPRTSPIDGHPQVAVKMDQDGKPIGLTVASMDGHGRVLRKLFTERPDLLDTIPRHGGRLSIAYDRVKLQTDGEVRGERLRPEDADRSRERIPGRLLHEYLRLCREGALDKPGTKPGRTPKRPSFERWIATLPPSVFKGAGDSSYTTTFNGHILTDRAVEEGCRPPRDNEPDDPHGAMAALRRIVLEAPDDVVGPTPISEQPTPLTERSNEVFELGVMSAHVTVGKDPSGRWRLLERPYAPVHPGDVLTQWCAQLQAGSRRRLLSLIRRQLSGRVVGPEAGPGGYIGSRPTDSDADPPASAQGGPALRAESAASLPSPPDQGRQMPVQGGSGTVDAPDGPVPSTAWPPLDGTKPFREWLRAARLARGLTQAQLAAGIGVPNSATYIGSLERGVAITRDMAVRLLAGLGAPEEVAEAVLREYFPDEGGEFPDPGSDRFRHPKDWIIAARTSKGLSRSELAARAGVGLTGLSQKERAQYPRGEFGIRPDYALRLLAGLAAPSDIVTAFMSRFYPGWEPDVSADGRRNTGPDGFIGNRPRNDEPEDPARAGARVPADLIGPVDARAGLPTYSPPDAELRMRADRVLREHWGAGASPDDLVYRWRRSTAKRATAAAEECAQHAARNARRARNLSVDELRALVRVWPEFVGKAGGFPKGVRDQANRWAYAKTRIALDTAAVTTRLSGRERALREYLLNVEDLLIRAGQRAATVETPGVPTPTVLLERFDTDDPGAGSIMISFGSADPVAEAWHVDGTDRDLRRLDQRMQLACNHYEAAVRENAQRPVRVVVWSGTDGHRLAGDLAVSADVDTGSAPHPAVRPERQLVVYGDGGRPAKKALAHEWVARTTDAVVVCGESNLEAMSDALADVASSTDVYYGVASRPGASGKAGDVPGIRFTSRFPKGDAGRTNAVLKDVRDRAQRYEKEPFEEGKPIDDEFLLYVDDRTKAPTESLENMGRILAGCPDRVARHNPLQNGWVRFTECIERAVDEQTRFVYADILPRDPHTGTPTLRAITGDAALARSAIEKRGGPGARPEILSHLGLPDDFTRAGRLAIENKRWWNSLHRDEQRAVVAIHPGIIGNAPGLPSEVANYANDYRRSTTASAIHARGRKNASRAERQVFRNLYAVGEALTRSVTVHRDIPPPVVATVALDPEAFGGNGSGTFVIGNCRLEDADHVVWYVDGVNTRLQSAPARLGSARNLYEELVRADPSVKVAVVCWIGYEAPANYKEAWASRPELAEAGGRLFARDVLALRAVTGARMSKLGYSYGTPVVAEGGVGGRLDGVFEHGVVMGSPGRGRRFDSATDGSSRRTWVLAQSDDPVTGFGGDAPDARGRLLGDGPLGLGTDPATDIVATRVRAERGFPYSLAPFDGHGEYLQYSLIGAAQPTESLRHAAWCLAGRGDEVPTEQHRPTVDNPTAMHRIRARVVDAARDRRAPQLDAALDTPGDHRSRRDLPVPAAGVVIEGDGSPRSGAMQAAGAAVGPSEGTRVGPRLAVRLGKDGLADAGRACADALVLGVDSIVVEVGRAAGDMAALDMICRSAAHADAALAVELPTGPAWPESEIRAKVAAIAATLRRHGIRGQLHAFDLRVATAGAELAPDWQRVAMVNTLTVAGKGMRGATGWMTRALRPGAAQIDAIIDHARRAGATGLAIPYQLLSENFVRRTTEGGMRLAVWGVTGSGRMRESLRMDVGEIWARKTEDLALLRAEVAESGFRIPEAFAPPPPPDGPPRATPWSGSTGR
ncbi:alpha/beta hydrolase [Nocardia asiatica]|uniref:alpha/beta hydrolase n=1 Tax=Nocardia asiatica TaxID=209252 RepID=UPI003EE3E986